MKKTIKKTTTLKKPVLDTNGQDTSNPLKYRCFLSPVAITVSVSQAV